MTTSASPPFSSRCSLGRSKNGSATKRASDENPATRLSILVVRGQEHDVFGSHGDEAFFPRRQSLPSRVDLVDAQKSGSRSNAVLGELAEVRRLFERDGHGVHLGRTVG